VNAGKAQTAYMMRQHEHGHYLPFTYIAIGRHTAATATAPTWATEITSAGGARASGHRVHADHLGGLRHAQLTKTFTFTTSGTFAVSEFGVFNSSTGAPMLCRQTFATINVIPNDTLAVT